MRTLAFIPAKGYSERLPSKNSQPVGGLCLWTRAVQIGLEAKRVGLVHDVALSTDDGGIYSSAGIKYADQPLERWTRPNYPNIHDADWGRKSVAELLRFHLEDQRNGNSRGWELVCVLWPTSPLRTLRHVVESRLLVEDGWDGVLSVVPFRPQVALVLADETGRIGRADSAAWKGDFWKHDGTSCWIRTAIIRDGGHFYTGRMRPYFVPPSESVDVDTPEDLLLAEAMWRRSQP